MTPSPTSAPQKVGARGERGSYLMFDPNVWEVVAKNDVELIYEEVEPAPRLPRGKGGGL